METILFSVEHRDPNHKIKSYRMFRSLDGAKNFVTSRLLSKRIVNPMVLETEFYGIANREKDGTLIEYWEIKEHVLAN